MTDRQRMFDYLDGVADGLNESRNDVADVLDKIRAEISAILTNSYDEGVKEKALQIVDKYRG